MEQSGPHGRFDWGGLISFVIAMLAINVFISQGPKLGWFSYGALGLLLVFAVAILVFFHLETSRRNPFVDMTIFRNATFSGATLSNFLLNDAAGTLVVALGLVQTASGWTALQSGLLTLGYLVATWRRSAWGGGSCSASARRSRCCGDRRSRPAGSC